MLQIQENGISELKVVAAQWGHIALENVDVMTYILHPFAMHNAYRKCAMQSK